jgi:hypothetical protein
MKLKMKGFSGYQSEVYDEIAKWSEGKEGRVVSVQVIGDAQGRLGGEYQTFYVWYWDGEPTPAVTTPPINITIEVGKQ